MAADHILALDQGTTSSRAIVFDRAGRWSASPSRSTPKAIPRRGM